MQAASVNNSAPPNIHARTISTSLAFILFMCLSRVIFCYLSPEVLSGYDALEADIKMLLAAAILSSAGMYYIRARNEFVFAMLLFTPAFLLFAGLAGLRAQYIIFHMGREFALVDEKLASLDSLLGFRWVPYFVWVTEQPILNEILDISYNSIWWQPLILFMMFIYKKDSFRFGQLQISMSLSVTLVCLVAFFLPALGAYQFHKMTPDQHLGIKLAFTDGMTAPIQWLRQANLPAVLPSFPDLRLVTFPSWHASAAVIYVLSAWTVPFVRWPSILLNILMLAATPVQGSHYLSDMIVGGGLGGIAFALAAWLLAPRLEPRASGSLEQAKAFEPAMPGPRGQISA